MEAEALTALVRGDVSQEAFPCPIYAASDSGATLSGTGCLSGQVSGELKGVPGEWHLYAARLSHRVRVG
jgi:hypothetical protein